MSLVLPIDYKYTILYLTFYPVLMENTARTKTL